VVEVHWVRFEVAAGVGRWEDSAIDDAGAQLVRVVRVDGVHDRVGFGGLACTSYACEVVCDPESGIAAEGDIVCPVLLSLFEAYPAEGVQSRGLFVGRIFGG
jgi:hypothetical protein